MRTIFILSLVVLGFLGTGCAFYYKFDTNDPLNRRYMPKRPNWSLSINEPADPEGRICYDSIYVKYNPPGKWHDGGYTLKRHFPDGQYIADGIHPLDGMVERMNDLRNTAIGRFQVRGMEIIYEGIVVMDRGAFFYTWGEIQQNGDVWLQRSGPRNAGWLGIDRTRTFPEPSRYQRIKVEGLKPLELDW